MYKDKLQGVITERYLNGKIATNRYIRLMEKTENITEGKALDLLSEIKMPTWSGIKAGAGALSAKAGRVTGFGGPARRTISKFKQARELLKNTPKDHPYYAKYLKDFQDARKAAAITLGRQGATLASVGGAGYGGYKVATRKKKKY